MAGRAWEWPATYDRDGAIELARHRGRLAARRWSLTEWDSEDLVQEAQCALLVEWPKLCARYALPSGRVEGGLIVVAVDADLVDYIRRERHTRRIDQPRSVPLQDVPVVADEDTEADAIRRAERLPELDDIIERLLLRVRYSEHTKRLLRHACRRLADDVEVSVIAEELGYTRSHILALITRFRKQCGRAL